MAIKDIGSIAALFTLLIKTIKEYFVKKKIDDRREAREVEYEEVKKDEVEVRNDVRDGNVDALNERFGFKKPVPPHEQKN